MPRKTHQKQPVNPNPPTKAKAKLIRSLLLIQLIILRHNRSTSFAQSGGSADAAPWFDSLVKDVASVLNKNKQSPPKRKRVVSPPKNPKRSKDGSDSLSDSDSDFCVEFDDDDYYNMDEFDPDNSSKTGDRHSSLDQIHKEQFLTFMKDFVESYSSRPSREGKRNDGSRRPCPSHKSLRFASDSRDSERNSRTNQERSFTFGCMAPESPTKYPTSSRSNSHDSALIKSLRSDKASNKLAETFLQLAGLSHKDSADLFKSANAKKSGEHRKASDCAPIPNKWPQELLDRPRGSETSYNELTLAEFMSGNLGLMDLGLNSSNSNDNLRNQLHYYRTLCDDVVDYGWPLVREAHKLVLIALEQGQLNPADIDGLLEKRKTALERGFRHQKVPDSQSMTNQNPNVPSTSSGVKPNSSDKNAPGVLLRVCKHYNDGQCNFAKEHQKGAYLWTHICGHCWHRLKQKRSHPECECETKKKDMPKQGKNEKGGT